MTSDTTYYTYYTCAYWTSPKVGNILNIPAESNTVTICNIVFYMDVDDDTQNNFFWNPRDASNRCKTLKRLHKEGKIANLAFGRKITVSCKTGKWEIVRIQP